MPKAIDGDHLYWLGFSAFPGIGPRRFALLRNFFGSAQKAWEATGKELEKVGLNSQLVGEFLDFRKNLNLDSYYFRLRENKIECYFLDGKNYPENLKKIDDPPFVLYVKGAIRPEDSLSIAVVGTRAATSYGRQATEIFVEGLVAYGITIVSGLARGIDTVAHRTTLVNGGRTIAVLGGGFDRLYPAENARLVAEIVDRHGAVISEYPLGTAPLLSNFPARNRIISGLTLATLVIECPEKSGAMITARWAAEQGREVFVVPGPIYSRTAAGPLSLARSGASLVSKPEEIIKELNLPAKIGLSGEKKKNILIESAEERLTLSLLENENKHIDQIVRESGLDVGRVLSIISVMEIKGKVKNLGRMVYGRAR